MPRGNWSIVVALVGCLILTAANQTHKNPGGHQAEQPAHSAEAPPPPYAAYPDKYADTCYGTKDHDAADLCAQWRAALATEKAAHEARRATTWAIVATFLSFATVIGLIVTIWQTFGALGEARRGNRLAMRENARATRRSLASARETATALAAAERTADAAAKQAQIADDTAKRQLRAYVTVRDTQTTALKPDDKATFSVKLVNTGRTPGYGVMIMTRIQLSTVGPDQFRFRFGAKSPEYSTADVGAGQSLVHLYKMDSPLLPDLYQGIVDGSVTVIFAGIISYRDAFGRLRRTLFRYHLDPDMVDLKEGVWHLVACAKGNSSN